MYNCSLRRYEIMAIESESKGEAKPKMYKLTVFAKNLVQARSRFWNDLKRTMKIKKSIGKIVSEKDTTDYSTESIRNFAIKSRYTHKGKIVESYREYRTLSTPGAVRELYDELKSRHSIKKELIQILEIKEVADEELVKEKVKRFTVEGLEFAHPFINRMPINKKLKQKYVKLDDMISEY
eukprot:GAHX01000781.1.p1 GENE.GAHX01000781.1~~GAHX01000781.1.p1  ORF type:complete len:191 (-),score=40.88 GAHX01000781.1:29-568(-)